MSRIFISHSSANNAAALAVATYLAENGWTDHFLDVSADQGLLPGERWQAALKTAADRCEAVVFLISPAWRDSRWCLAEFLLAKQLGKKIFGVLVEPTALETLPVEMTAEWQLCDLTRGEERRTFTVRADGVVPETRISFSESGLARLQNGLQKAGLDPSTFRWPPLSDPERAPYRGLKPLDVDDAAVFFGRDVSITRGLDALRRMRERGLEGLFVILGASGAGKSSYLRAGLWPRLARDDAQFLPLPVIRPHAAVMTGPGGLVDSLDAALRTHKVPRTRAEIRSRLQSPDGFRSLLTELHLAGHHGGRSDESPPTIVIPIDQGEELFVSEGRVENERFLSILRDTLGDGSGSPGEAATRAVAIIAIRSDAYDRLQLEPLLATVRQVPFNLSPIARGEFKKIITGPAEQATAARRPLTVDPVLTERLLQDAEGPDALPLLAFTLERLLLDYGGDGELSADDYDALGGVRGSIEAAVEAAFAKPTEAPVVPPERDERERLLRRAFIPWLAQIDPDTDGPRRRVAALDEIPSEARAVLARLTDARLVVSDRREVDGQAATVVEVAHEALLRQWPALTRWLDEDADALKTVDAVRRASQEWAAHGRQGAWLLHTADRLQRAESLRNRADLDNLMGAVGREYLHACRARDEQATADREAQLARIAAEQALTARAQRRSRIALGAIALVLAGFGVWVVAQTRMVARQQAAVLTVAAGEALKTHQFDRALRFAVLAARATWLSPSVPDAEAQLSRAAWASFEVARVADSNVSSASFTPDGERIVAAFSDGARLLDAQSLREIARVPYPHGPGSAAFSPDGRRVVTTSQDGTVRISDASAGTAIATIAGDASAGLAVFSPDGRRVVRAGHAGTRVFDAETGAEIARLPYEGSATASISPNGQRIVTTIVDVETAWVWDANTGREIARVAHGNAAETVAFSPEGRFIATGSTNGPVLITNADTGQEIARLGDNAYVISAQFSPDGTRLLTLAYDGTARVFNGLTAAQPLRFPIQSAKSIAFTPDGRTIVASGGTATQFYDAFTGAPDSRLDYDISCSSSYTAHRRRVVAWCQDKTLRLYEANAHEMVRIRHDDHVESVAFSPDGLRLVTASRDRSARVVDARTGQEIARAAHDSYVTWAAFSPDGQFIASRSWEKGRVFDAATGRERVRVDHAALIESVAFSPDGHRIVTASQDGTARIADVDSGRETVRIRHDDRVESAAFSPDGHRCAASTTFADQRQLFLPAKG